jgi:two-component system NtrC family sensor kinase
MMNVRSQGYSVMTASVFSPQNLRLDSTLKELSLFECQVEVDAVGMVLSQIFETNPGIPGVMLKCDREFVGMISRRRFLERLSRPYGRELFLTRSIRTLYRFAQIELLILPGDTPIVDAAHQAIRRSPGHIYEPIVVQVSPEDHRLLDTQQLLIVQSYIHQLATELLRQQTQSQLIQSEKLASLGQMVAGVAHEIRNPVGCIVGNTEFLSNYCEDLMGLLDTYEEEMTASNRRVEQFKEDIDFDFVKTDLLEMIRSIKISSERLNSLVSSLRSFSHMDQNNRRETDIHECLESTLLILKNRLKIGIEVIKNYGDIPKFLCYSGLLSQVFMNLLANAIDAVEENPKNGKEVRKIWISTHMFDGFPPESRSLQIPPESEIDIPESALTQNIRCIVIRITDNGCGIPPEIQTRIFENFFTTKSADKGTGLGLAIGHQIVQEKHGGSLNLRSLPGVGTEFEIVLPLM